MPVGATAEPSSSKRTGSSQRRSAPHQPGRRPPAPYPCWRRPEPGPGTDGRWSAPDGRHLFTWKMTAGTLLPSPPCGPSSHRSASPGTSGATAWQLRRRPKDGAPGSSPSAGSTSRQRWGPEVQRRRRQRNRCSRHAERKPAGRTGVDVLPRGLGGGQPATVALPDGAGGLRPAAVDDLTRPSGVKHSRQPVPQKVKEVFRILAGEHGVSLDDGGFDEQRLSDSGAPGVRVLPVTLLGFDVHRRDAPSVRWPGHRR